MHYCISMKNNSYPSTRNGALYNSTCIPAFCYLNGLPLLVSRMVGSQLSSYTDIVVITVVSLCFIYLIISFIPKCDRDYNRIWMFKILGYEPADLTCTPPTSKRSRVGLFFSHRCLVAPKFFPQRKNGFCRRYSH